MCTSFACVSRISLLAFSSSWTLSFSAFCESNVRFELGRALVGLAAHDLTTGDEDAARTRLRAAVDAFGTFGGPEADQAQSLLAIVDPPVAPVP